MPDEKIPVRGMPPELIGYLEALAPGQALEISLENGDSFVLMQSDDFHHIAGLAGLKSRSAGPLPKIDLTGKSE